MSDEEMGGYISAGCSRGHPTDHENGRSCDERIRWEGSEVVDHCWCKCHWGNYYVNVYEVDREWGGAEEGGWWYDTGKPIASTPFDTFREAEAFELVMEYRFPRTGTSSSVIYGGGDYIVVIEKKFAQPYPEARPHYE